MPPSLSMLIPLVSGLGYAVAALMLKRGGEGAAPWRVTFVANMVIATVFFFGLFLAVVDWLVQRGVAYVFKIFGV